MAVSNGPTTLPHPGSPHIGWQIAAGALMLGGPTWHYLHTNHYRLEDPGAVVVPCLAAAVGALVTVVARKLPNWLAIFPFAAVAFLFVDLQFEFEYRFYALGVAGVTLLAVILLGKHREVVVSVALGAFYLSSIPMVPRGLSYQSAGLGPPPDRNRPFLLHLVLDAQWGPGGFRAAGDSATADWLTGFYRDRGFHVYSGAYSRTYLTRYSIGETFALGQVPQIAERPEGDYRLTQVPYFAELGRRGYDVRVVQSSYLDLCPAGQAGLSSCVTAPWRSIANIGDLEGSWTHRAIMVGRYVLNANSHVYRRLGLDPEGGNWRMSYAGRAVVEMDSLAREIRHGAAPGVAMIAHLVFPHGPFELNEACAMHTDFDRRLGEMAPKKVEVDPRWPERLDAYKGQMRCAHRGIASLIAAVDSAVGADNAVIVIQGDHGSRMALHPVPRTVAIETFTTEQLNAAFATLLVVRAPGLDAGVTARATPVQQWFAGFFHREFRAVDSGPWRHYVVRPPTKAVSADTLRPLSDGELVWANEGSRPPNFLTLGNQAFR